MKRHLRVLIVEDSEEDTLLIIRELRQGGFDPIHERVETAESMKAALSTKTWDLILADYSMPHFSGLEALKLLKESELDLPFIIVSGTIGEDVAVEAVKAGAHDYIMKNNLKRLITSVEQELREAEVRRKLKESEKRFQESQRSLEAVIETAPSLIVLTDPEGRITLFNRACEELTGYKREEVVGKTITELFLPPEWIPVVQKRFADPYAPEVRAPHENPWVTKSGEERLIEWRCTVLSSPQDGRPCILGIGLDITERKQVEEELRESEDRFRQFFENEPAYCYMISLEGIILNANKATFAALGYEKEELIGKPVTTIYAPESLPKVKGNLEMWKKTGRLEDREVEIITKRGERRTVLLSVDAVRDKNGKILHSVSVQKDITERKQAEEELRASEKTYKTLIENLPQKIFLKDVNSVYVSCNENYAYDLKIKPEEIVGKTDYEFYPKELAEKYRSDDKKVMGLGEVRDIEEEYIKDGQEFFVHTVKTPVRDEKGNVVGILGIFWDITKRKRAEEEMAALQEQLRQSQKMEAIGHLAGGIAHDFNNLLTVIKGYSQLSLIELKENDPMRGNIEEIKRATDRASDLTRQLLAFSRRQILEMKVLNLNTVLQNLDKMLHRIIGEDVELVTLLTKDLWRVKTDPGQVEQVIMNLAVNARDAMPYGGKLTIETANAELDEAYARAHVAVTPGRYVMLSVSDTGAGMTPEVRERVFEPFFTTKEKGRGTGLGLSTVYGIVKQSGGNIWVYSEPGHGTTFKIYLPHVDEPLEELKEKVEKEELLGGSETILVVEDEEKVLKLAGQILKGQGYRVLEAATGEEALKICKKNKESFHLLLTDVVMPQMDGRQLAEQLKQVCRDFKVLYMSGYTDNAITHHGILEKGMNYIQKPFTLEGLARKVREVLDKV